MSDYDDFYDDVIEDTPSQGVDDEDFVQRGEEEIEIPDEPAPTAGQLVDEDQYQVEFASADESESQKQPADEPTSQLVDEDQYQVDFASASESESDDGPAGFAGSVADATRLTVPDAAGSTFIEGAGDFGFINRMLATADETAALMLQNEKKSLTYTTHFSENVLNEAYLKASRVSLFGTRNPKTLFLAALYTNERLRRDRNALLENLRKQQKINELDFYRYVRLLE